MAATTSIEWTATLHPDGSVTPGRTWNPVRGCSVISPGCVNCYAMKQAHRFSGPGRAYEGLTKLTSAGPQWTGVIRTVDHALLEPLSWRKPQKVFVNSMSDLFHEDVPWEFVDRVFAVMARATRHTFQVLTKRADRMRDYLTHADTPWRIACEEERLNWAEDVADDVDMSDVSLERWPLPNIWLGVSVEDQQRADERIPLLLRTPAAVRFLSCEPLLGETDLTNFLWTIPGARLNRLHWVIVGGESGPRARDMKVCWVRDIVEQCQSASVPVFVKQLGARVIDRNDAGFLGEEPDHWPDVIDQEDRIEYDLDGTRDGYQGAPVRIHLKNRKGNDPAEWPEDLRVREFPR